MYMTLKPLDLAVSEFFTLDSTSNILELYKKMQAEPSSNDEPSMLAPPKASIREVVSYNDFGSDDEDEVVNNGDIGSTSYKKPRDIEQSNGSEMTVQQ